MKRRKLDYNLIAFSLMAAAGGYFLVITLIGIIKNWPR